MFDTFMAQIQEQGRIVIPSLIRQLRKLKQGDKVNVKIEKITTEKKED